MRSKQQNRRTDIFPAQHPVAGWLRDGYHRIKTAWATWMSKQSLRLSTTTLKMGLALFILSASSFCTYIVLDAFNEKPALLKPASIRKPGHINETGEVFKTATELSKKEYQRIEKSKTYMDSLFQSTTGKAIYDSIIKKRPRLMDSIGMIENYFQQELKQQ